MFIRKKNSIYLPLNFCALVPKTDANFPIESLVCFSNCTLDAAASLVSMLEEQHEPVSDGTSQYRKDASESKKKI